MNGSDLQYGRVFVQLNIPINHPCIKRWLCSVYLLTQEILFNFEDLYNFRSVLISYQVGFIAADDSAFRSSKPNSGPIWTQ